ncbi:MAG: magnesium transporter [bacterium]|jgi:magnesium transporter
MEASVLDLFRRKGYYAFKTCVARLAPADIAEIMEGLDPKDTLLFFRLLPKDLAVDVFAYLPNKPQQIISELISKEELQLILEDLNFDDKIDYLEEMPANLIKKILQNTPESERKIINQFLNYPEYSAGSLMTIEYVNLRETMTVNAAVAHIRKTGVDKETIYLCYVTDNNRKLKGVLSLRELILADEQAVVGDLMKKDFIAVTTLDDQENVASLFKKYDFLALPVVDREKRLVGIITIDDIIDVIEDENTEDFHKMGALQRSDTEYLNAGVINLARQRLTWLLVLMVSAMFTGHIIRRYESVLQSIVALAVFIPVLMDTGGNAGAQSSTLIIRSLALGQVTIRDYLKVIAKELQVSVLVGAILAAINYARIIIIDHYPADLALTVSLTLFITVILAKMIGGVLPLAAKRLNLDPAIMASPLITTIVDAIALTTYFALAGLLLGFGG